MTEEIKVLLLVMIIFAQISITVYFWKTLRRERLLKNNLLEQRYAMVANYEVWWTIAVKDQDSDWTTEDWEVFFRDTKYGKKEFSKETFDVLLRRSSLTNVNIKQKTPII